MGMIVGVDPEIQASKHNGTIVEVASTPFTAHVEGEGVKTFVTVSEPLDIVQGIPIDCVPVMFLRKIEPGASDEDTSESINRKVSWDDCIFQPEDTKCSTH